MRYRTESGTERDLPADPWAVVIRHGRWYLLCGTPTVAAPTASTGSCTSNRDPRPSNHRPIWTRSRSWRSISPPAGSSRPTS
ncbi:WYL domain-containing protein [Paractinoplanes durhamensis]|uniref:WYL domain-containing protein n=1 Tax=Paractinoplanes durhamensis TaxID=113563 RepID=UPI00362A08CA